MRDGRVERTAVSDVCFNRCCDVLVCGLGTAGAVALILSEQNGLNALGVELLGCMGGTASIGGVQSPYFDTPGGRYLAIEDEVTAYRAHHTHNALESRKLIYESIALEHGAKLMYETCICGVYMEGSTVVGVRALAPEGMVNIACRVLMDCTGDACIARMAGCATEFGRALDGCTQPYSMVSYMRSEDGTVVRTTNVDFGRVDQRDDGQLSRALIFSRAYEMAEDRQGMRFMLHMPLIGVREGQRIVAEDTVRVEDIFAGRYTDTPVFYAYADLDKHGWDVAFDGEALGDWAIGANLGAYNLTIPVPFGALIPRGVDGMLVPCRALGVDRDTASCVRMLTDMRRAAEAAADMAMLAIREGCRLKDIPYAELRGRLIASGCLKREYECNCRIDGYRDTEGRLLPGIDVRFTDDPAQLEQGLATLCPGQAIWSAKLMGARARDALRELLTSEDDTTRRHAALALAMTGDTGSVDILRSMVAERDGVMLKDCRKHNQQRGCMAIYLLGRLADAGVADTLIDIITDRHEPERPAYNVEFAMGTRYRIDCFRNEYFQFMTNAVMALIRIGDAHAELRGMIAEAFHAAFDDGSYYDRITTRPRMSSEGCMTLNIRAVSLAAAARWQQSK